MRADHWLDSHQSAGPHHWTDVCPESGADPGIEAHWKVAGLLDAVEGEKQLSAENFHL